MVDIPGRGVDNVVAAWRMRHADPLSSKFKGFVTVSPPDQTRGTSLVNSSTNTPETAHPKVRIIRLGVENPSPPTPTVEAAHVKLPSEPLPPSADDNLSPSKEMFPALSAQGDVSEQTGASNNAKQRKRVTGGRAIAVSAALAGTLTAAACSSGDGSSPSYNYAGYGVKGIGNVTGVTEDFTVPDLNCEQSGGNSLVAIWTGIGGNNTGTLQQDGILEGCETPTGGPTIVAFTEMFPQAAKVDDIGGNISPGDKMQIGVMSLGGNKFDLFVRDTTTGKGKDRIASCGKEKCDQTQGLWIAEKQTEHSGPQPLALSYWTGPIAVSAEVQAKNGGYTPLGEINPSKLITYKLVDDSGTLAAPTPPKPGSGSFSIIRYAPKKPQTTNS